MSQWIRGLNIVLPNNSPQIGIALLRMFLIWGGGQLFYLCFKYKLRRFDNELLWIFKNRSRDSWIGIATELRVGRSVVRISVRKEIFLFLYSPFFSGYRVYFPRVKLKARKSGAIPPIPMCAFTVCTRTTCFEHKGAGNFLIKWGACVCVCVCVCVCKLLVT